MKILQVTEVVPQWYPLSLSGVLVLNRLLAKNTPLLINKFSRVWTICR